MTVGFVHGVMNTDNMSILGLTIDYGPYGWLESYDPEWTPNTTDFHYKRYTFGQQPSIAIWNLTRLAQALAPLVSQADRFNVGLDAYRTVLSASYFSTMLKKLGLSADDQQEDRALIDHLHEALISSEIDMTLFFRLLSHAVKSFSETKNEMIFKNIISESSYADAGSAKHTELLAWLNQYAIRFCRMNQSQRRDEISTDMLKVNPKYVLRNYLSQTAIEKADDGNMAYFERLFGVLRRPFDEQTEHNDLAAKRPEWAKNKAGSATLSCSS